MERLRDPDQFGHTWKWVRVSDGKVRYCELRCTVCDWRAPDVRPRPNCPDEVVRQVTDS